MINKRFLLYILLTSLGFFAAIGVGMFIFFNFRSMTGYYSSVNKQFYEEYADYLNKSTLANMAEYIEMKYPELQNTALLRKEAGTDWFWEFSGDFKKIKDTFGFSYIYYVEKIDGKFIFLLSSGIQRDEHPEWLGGPVWLDEPPDYVTEAWDSGRLALSLVPTVNEWGTNISAALPIFSGAEIAGILGIDFDISFMDGLIQREQSLQVEEAIMTLRMRNILIFSIVIILAFMAYQIWMSATSSMISLKEAEADSRTRLMLEATPMLCSLWDTDGNIIDCDGETLQAYGLKAKSDYINHFYDLNPEYQPSGENTRSAVQRIIKEVLDTGYVRMEWHTRARSGETIPVESTVVRVPWKKGYSIAVFSRDLREDLAKEEALRESETRLRVMLDTMALACYFFDPDCKMVDCNQRAVNLFNCKDRNELMERFFDLSPERQSDNSLSREKAISQIRETFETGKTYSYYWHHLKTDGSLLPSEVTLIRVQWKDGYRVIAYLKDLSDLVETEDRLRRILATAEASPNFTAFIGADGTLEYMNPAVFSSSGFSLDELQKGGLSLIFSPDDYDRLNRMYIKAALVSEIANFEMTLIEKSGKMKDFYFSAFSVQLYNWSKGIGLIGIDVTEQKQIHRDLALAKEQAERALESEVKYNKAKSDFLSRVSHELRTPLNAIIGITDIAEKKKDKAGLENGIAKIRDSSKQLLWLVNDIVDMTGIDTGHFDFMAQPFSFSKAMNQVIEEIALNAKVKNQEFNFNIDSGIPDCLVSDERRVRQILLNLLHNAVKFTPEEGQIELNASCLGDNGEVCTIRFEVVDNGIGISPNLQKHFGEAMEQADNSITRQYGGLGLGLSLTKRIVEIMNGRISVESEEGKGSRFVCDIRFQMASADEDEENEAAEDESSLPDEAADLNLAGKCVLIVDDVEINRDILSAMLEDSGAAIECAREGDEAVQMLSRKKYDLVLMDLHMPVMDGFTAAKKIRTSSLPWAKTVPIISVSAESSVDLHWKCREAGINEHLAKPVAMEALFGIISKWVAG